METRYRRASATPEELEERRREANGEGDTTTTARRQTITRTDRQGSVIGRSAIRHRPIHAEFVIPMQDGTDLHVTERELSSLPQAYKDAAILVTPAPPKRQAFPESRPQEPHTDDLPRQRHHHRFHIHWLVFVGGAMLLMVVGWILFSSVTTWWMNQVNNWTYGMPRTYQVDANVGHGTPTNPNSHFLAMNLQGHIMVIEVPGDNASQMKVYTITYLLPGQDASLVPVTVSFKDVDNSGKLALIVTVQDSHFVFLNTGTEFRAAPNQQQYQ